MSATGWVHTTAEGFDVKRGGGLYIQLANGERILYTHDECTYLPLPRLGERLSYRADATGEVTDIIIGERRVFPPPWLLSLPSS